MEKIVINQAVLPHTTLSKEDADALLQHARTIQFNSGKSRKVKQYGTDYTYSGRTYKGNPMPEWMSKTMEYINSITGSNFDSCLVNFYPKGISTGIGFHRDDEPELITNKVCSISLGQTCDFELQGVGEVVNITLEHGDVLVMDEDCQEHYKHGIRYTVNPEDRYSLTFRQFTGERKVVTPPSKDVVAIIGTAGRSRVPTLQEWDYMLQKAIEHVKPTDWLVSGGAAWADHIAVQLYLDGLVAGITLHLPAPFFNGKFSGGDKSSGSAANYYHKKMSEVLGYSTLDQISEVLACAPTEHNVLSTFQPAQAGYSGLFARNKLVAKDASRMIAFTYGTGDAPADGGTKDTWDQFVGDKLHVPISSTNEFTIRLEHTKIHFKVLKKELADDLVQGMLHEVNLQDTGKQVRVKHYEENPSYIEMFRQGINAVGTDFQNASLYRFIGATEYNLIPVPAAYINLGGTIDIIIDDNGKGQDITLEHGDIMYLEDGISHYTVTAVTEGPVCLLMYGNHHDLKQFANSGVWYKPYINSERKGGYECSSKGDKRFSAMFAKLPDGRTIEQHYQCDVKGYDVGGINWKLGKGKPPVDPNKNIAKAYLGLWHTYLSNNPELKGELLTKAKEHNNTLSDMFANTAINQADALACLLSLYIQEGRM